MNEITFYGADWCPDCRRAKAFLDEHDIAYTYVDIELDDGAVKIVERINSGKRVIPTIEVLGRALSNPSNAELAAVLGVNPVGRVIFYGADWCPDCRRAKSYLESAEIRYQFVPVDEYEWAASHVESVNGGKRIIPTIIIRGEPHANPDNAALRELLHLDDEVRDEVYDCAVVGGGVTGLTTAIYLQREKLSSIVLEKRNVGGNAFLTERIENYPGFESISGPELADRMAAQARGFGAEVREGIEVTRVSRDGALLTLETTAGPVRAHAAVIAVGSTYRQLSIPKEAELIGSGIHFCATCDAPFYRDRDVLVIGGGNSAVEEAAYLSDIASAVTLVTKDPQLTASGAAVQKLEELENVTVQRNVTPVEFFAGDDDRFAGLRVTDNTTGEKRELEADGAFIFIGLVPNTAFLEGIVKLDARGFVLTPRGSVATEMPGLFAAGDCRSGAIAQVATAVGEGTIASFAVKEHLRAARNHVVAA